MTAYSLRRILPDLGPALPGSRLDRLYRCQQLISRLRAEGWTIRSIAKHIGIAERSVSDWSRGRRAPSAEQLDKLRKLEETMP
jgi:hypothetical protein